MKKYAIRRYGSEEDQEKLRMEIMGIVFGNTKSKETVSNKDFEHHSISKSFSEKFGLKSDLKSFGDKGKFTISFSTKEELDKLLSLLNELNINK